MEITFTTPDEYVAQLSNDKREIIQKIRTKLLENLPEGFREEIGYGMIGYVVPHSLYPAGYQSNPKLPLPFINLASQKNYIALYHMSISAMPELLAWFQTEYPKHCKTKLDMGRGCIRFKKPDDIPYELIGELAGKVSVTDWIEVYERVMKRTKK